MPPSKAYNNLKFLNSPEARIIRMMCEYEEPRVRFVSEGVDATIVFFGSARALPPEVARVRLEHAQHELERAVTAEEQAHAKTLVESSERRIRMSSYYEASRVLSRRLTNWSVDRERGPRYVVCSGGGPGVMEAANRGASDVEGGKSAGLCISLPFEEQSNQYVTPELAFEFHYFFMRKYWFVFLSKCLVVFPGGFGTMDELMESLTLCQTGKLGRPLPIVLFGSEYWKQVLRQDVMLEWGTISATDLEYVHFVDSVDEAFAYIVNALEQMEQGTWVEPVRRDRPGRPIKELG
jgi:uncharacterized protein (TIGR00730 family)